MSVGNITAIFLAVAAILGAAFTYLTYRSQTKKQKLVDAERAKETSGITLSTINTSISNERDRAVKALEDQTERHTEEIERLRREHNQEIEDLRNRFENEALEMKRGYDKQIEGLSQRLAACQATVDSLYKELYELQRLLPLRPPLPPLGE